MDRPNLRLALLILLAFAIEICNSTAIWASKSLLESPRSKVGRERPLVAIAVDNNGTETADVVVPFGVLREADVADVVIVSTQPGVVDLMPALKIRPDMTMADFDRAYPEGADIVIVPAMHDGKNRQVVTWVRQQYSQGAAIVSICEGARLVAEAGVFNGRQATTHWYALGAMHDAYPRVHWVPNQRYVVDAGVMSTAGVSASVPAALALVEAITETKTARSVAAHLGLDGWDAAHDAAPFRLTASRLWRIAGNYLAFWSHETIRLRSQDGVDEIALALTADAWSRTYRSRVVTVEREASIRSRNGLVLVPDLSAEADAVDIELPTLPAAQALDYALRQIATRYGAKTSDLVRLQLEYPAQP